MADRAQTPGVWLSDHSQMELIHELLVLIRRHSPLIHHVTNQVTMDACASVAYGLGARATMAFHESETPWAAGQADAVVWNLGTFHPDMAAGIQAAWPVVCARSIPLVLDPVGIHSYPGRLQFVLDLLQGLQDMNRAGRYHCRLIIRGNAGELCALARAFRSHTGQAPAQSEPPIPSLDFGVDQNSPIAAIEQEMTALAKQLNLPGLILIATGKTDWLAEYRGEGQVSLYRQELSCTMLTRITGAGCLSNTVIAACAAVGQKMTPERMKQFLRPDDERPEGSAVDCLAALTLIVTTAIQAEQNCHGPASFRLNWLDALAAADGLIP